MLLGVFANYSSALLFLARANHSVTLRPAAKALVAVAPSTDTDRLAPAPSAANSVDRPAMPRMLQGAVLGESKRTASWSKEGAGEVNPEVRISTEKWLCRRGQKTELAGTLLSPSAYRLQDGGAVPFVINAIPFPVGILEDLAPAIEERPQAQSPRTHPFVLAQSWRQQLDHDTRLTKSRIAAREGISRARVTQVMNLLRADVDLGDQKGHHTAEKIKIGSLRPAGYLL